MPIDRAIAHILGSQGRGNDTMIAHISPREAAILRLLGGSGATNPNTGLPEFDDSGLTEGYFSGQTAQPNYNLNVDQPADTGLTTGYFSGQQAQPDYNFQFDTPTQFGTESFSPSSLPASAPQSNFGLTSELSGDQGGGGGAFPGATPSTFGGGRSIGDQVAAATSGSGVGGGAPAPEQPGMVDQATEFLKKNRDLIGLAGTLGLGGYNQLRAGKQARAQENRIKALASPYRAQADQYLNAARTGNLLPAQQQQLEALRAQGMQNLANAGNQSGTAQQQLEQGITQQADLFRQNLMQTGLQLGGISDQLTLDAINAGYQADQQAQQAANSFYLSVFKALGSAGK